jgi:hypothetical protein
MNLIEKVTEALESHPDQVDITADSLAELLNGVGEKFPDLVELSNTSGRVLVSAPKIKQVIHEKRIHDNRQSDVDGSTDFRTGPDVEDGNES